MRKIQLDFVPRPAFGKPVGLLLMAVGLAAAAASVLDVSDVFEARASLEGRKEAVLHRARNHEGEAVPKATLRPEERRALREAAAVASRLRTPWQSLFDATAQAAGADIALTGLQPDADSRTVRIAGLAHDLPAVSRFVDHLQEQAAFASAYVVQHDTQPKDAEAPLAFVVLATWREVAR